MGSLVGEYDQAGNIIQELVWLGDIPVATIRTDQSGGSVGVFYIHTDHLNAPAKITRPSDNQIIWRWDHDPYGNGVPNEDPDGNGLSLKFNLRFPGQYYDQETGLYYNMERFYDPPSGRYWSSDPIGLGGGINTYSYASDNPISNTDFAGLCGPRMHWSWNLHDGFYCTMDQDQLPQDGKPPPESPQCTSGDCVVFPPTTNCSCVQNCMKAQSSVSICRLIRGPKIGGSSRQPTGDAKIPGQTPSGGFRIPGVQDLCSEIVNEVKCENACRSFCSGCGPDPYPDK